MASEILSGSLRVNVLITDSDVGSLQNKTDRVTAELETWFNNRLDTSLLSSFLCSGFIIAYFNLTGNTPQNSILLHM